MVAGVPPTVSAEFDSNGDIVFKKKSDGTELLKFTATGIQSSTPVKPANVASAQVTPGTPVVYRIDVADAVTGDVDVVLTYRTRVLDVLVIKTGTDGASGNLITVKNGANAITDAIDMDVTDKAVKRSATIDDAYHEIAAAGTLRVTRTKAGGNAACEVYVHGVMVAAP